MMSATIGKMILSISLLVFGVSERLTASDKISTSIDLNCIISASIVLDHMYEKHTSKSKGEIGGELGYLKKLYRYRDRVICKETGNNKIYINFVLAPGARGGTRLYEVDQNTYSVVRVTQ